MNKHLLNTLQQSLFGKRRKAKQRTRPRNYRRTLSMESLESRQMLSITTLQNLSVSENTGEKPQSKVFEYAGQWWTVMPNSSGTWVFRLDGTNWTPTQQITTAKNIHADVKVVDDLAHVLLFNKSSSQLATLQYDAVDNRFEPWALQPQLVGVPISSSAETATLEVDSTGRLWVAYDVSTTVEVRYSDGLYTSWSSPITVASGMSSDDISTIVAMPNDSIGVLWSDQKADVFYFRTHVDGAAPSAWSANEVAASQWVSSVGGAMSDDHVNVAVTSDGTLYAAVKTGYDSSSKPEIALLVRRPNGTWDNLYQVDTKGTRPIVVVNEAAGKLIVAYTSSDGGGTIYYRESPLGNISFGAKQALISGSNNNVTSTKHTSTNEIVFLAGTSSTARGVLYRFDTTAPPPENQPPVVSAGPDRSVLLGNSAALDGTVSDDGLPTGSLTTTWTKVSGPGTVTFGNSAAVDTSASFSVAGDYVLRLSASDGLRTTSDEMTVTVSEPPAPPPTNGPPLVDAGPDQSITLGNSASLDGTVSDDGLPAPGVLSASWTTISGPGTVTFGNSADVDTSASFSTTGSYALQLTVSDGQLTASDNLTINVNEPPVIVKTILGNNGTLYELDSEHWLRVDGSRVWANTRDFTLDTDGLVYWHSVGGSLARRLSNGAWQSLDSNVTKFAVSGSGTVYSLAANGWLSVNGKKTWENTKDFAITANDTVYWLSTFDSLYVRPNSGSWIFIDHRVTKFSVNNDGAAYALRTDGWISVDGTSVWDRSHDFILTGGGTLYWHSTDKSVYKKPSGGSWQFLGQNMDQLAVRQDGTEYLLSSNGSVFVNGTLAYTGISQMLLDEFNRLLLERVGDTSQLIAGQFTLGRKLV